MKGWVSYQVSDAPAKREPPQAYLYVAPAAAGKDPRFPVEQRGLAWTDLRLPGFGLNIYPHRLIADGRWHQPQAEFTREQQRAARGRGT